MKIYTQIVDVQDETEEGNHNAMLRLEVDLASLLSRPHVCNRRLWPAQLRLFCALLLLPGLCLCLHVLDGREHLPALHCGFEELRGPGIELALQENC